MKRLLVAAALAPLSFAAAAAHAGTITGADTGTHQTATEGDVIINSGASVTPPTSATSGTVAVTLNSNNIVDNEGAITVTETTTGNSTNEGITDGPFANGSGRFGIQVSGAGPFTGNITTGPTSTITIVGENSAAIDVETGLNGCITDNGAISVTGGNAGPGGNMTGATDVSYGIFQAAGAPISGNVAVGGTISVAGANATGVALNGAVGGAVDISAAISTSGFRSSQAPALPSQIAALRPDQLLDGGPAVSIGGNVAGGIILEAPVAASGNVAATTGATLTVFGPAPALLIGGNQTVVIGPSSNTFSLTVGGAVSSSGVYPNVSAEGVQIGGVNPLFVNSGDVAPGGNFSTVVLTGGLDVSGTVIVAAEATASGAAGATGIEIGQSAFVPRIIVSGTVDAVQSNSLGASSPPPANATAIKFDVGAPVSSSEIINSGLIAAAVIGVAGVPGATVSVGGVTGNATAIDDEAGALAGLVNVGNISATITPEITGAPTVGHTVAIYENNSAPFILEQCSIVDSSGDCQTTGNASFNPNIVGDVIFAGTGGATVDLWGGNITGALAFGNNTGNALDIEAGGVLRGALTQVTGGAVAINVNNGELFMTSPANVTVSTLHVGSNGILVFTGDPADPSAAIFNVAGNATFDNGASIGLALLTPLTTQETFTLVESQGNLTAGNLSTAFIGEIPFLENGTINIGPNSLSITATPKTPKELGLNPAETAELIPFLKALGNDPELAADLLSKTDRPGFIHAYDQFLPDYAGGPFETLVTAQQEIARTVSETPIKLQQDGVRGWVQEIGYLNHQDDTANVNGYQGLGFGFAAGLERSHGDQVIGVTAAFVTTGVQDKTQPSDQALSATAFEAGAYWRKGGREGIVAYADANLGVVSMGSRRFFIDQTSANDLEATSAGIVSREAKANWIGYIASVSAGVGYQHDFGRFYARPEVSADYIFLSEPGYHEHGGGPAFDLNIGQRTSSQADVTADMVLGMNFGQTIIWRPEVTFGYRFVATGGPASTTASFNGGQTFTLTPQFTDRGGFLARIGVRASGQYADFSADAGGEFKSDYQTYNARAAARFLF